LGPSARLRQILFQVFRGEACREKEGATMLNIETREVKAFLSSAQPTFWPDIPQGCPERYQKMIVATRARRFNVLTSTNTFEIPDGNEGGAGLEELRKAARWEERAWLSMLNAQTEMILDGDAVKK